MRWMILVLVVGERSFGANIGAGYGESQLAFVSARQAGTGGVAVEDPWRQGTIFDATTMLYTAGLRWVGLGWQGGIGSTLRVGVDGSLFEGPSAPRTIEFSDGSYQEQQGTVDSREWGARVVGQWNAWSLGPWRVAAVGRASGLMQQLPDARHFGGAAEAGVQAQAPLGDARAVTGWATAGPLGGGAGRGSAWIATAGGGWLERLNPGRILGGPEGYGAGAEVEWLGEALLHAGAGAVYWVGDPLASGWVGFARMGLKSAAESAQTLRTTGGVGMRWKFRAGLAVQFDYAIAPLGALGLVHDATVGVRW